MSGEFVVVTDMLTHTENGADYGIFLITSCRMLYSAGQNRTVPDGFPPKACGMTKSRAKMANRMHERVVPCSNAAPEKNPRLKIDWRPAHPAY
jgi:hypothetical protein